MIKTAARFEYKIGDRIYQFICDHDAPLGEVHDALTKFKSHVVGVINSLEKNNETVKESNPVVG